VSDRMFGDWDLEAEGVTSGRKIVGEREKGREGDRRKALDNVEAGDEVDDKATEFKRLKLGVGETGRVGKMREAVESFSE